MYVNVLNRPRGAAEPFDQALLWVWAAGSFGERCTSEHAVGFKAIWAGHPELLSVVSTGSESSASQRVLLAVMELCASGHCRFNSCFMNYGSLA